MTKITIEDLEELVKINKYELDEVVCNQPVIFDGISEQYVQACSDRDFAKKEMAEWDAAIAIEYRQRAVDNNEKLTEAKLQEKVQVDERHQNAVSIFLHKNLIAEMWKGKKEVFQQRAVMAKLCCELYQANYYSENSMKSNKNTDEVQYKKAREAISRQKRG